MKPELKVKFLQHLTHKKKDEEGFTLIELLVVIIIIGVLSAVALPSLLNQAAKARAAEAKTNVGSMNRAQQAYYLEQQCFSTNVPDLVINLNLNTNNFIYSAEANGSITSGVTNFGSSLNNDIKSYAGGTFYIEYSGTVTEGATTTVLCENKNAGIENAAVPTLVAGETNPDCADTTKKIK